ncbi:response regulator [Lyngbya aestuarii]|uniref:response regulator n=1 Tax=Lyngbya aestuarii TaxID=118322 RepID=UPI00403DD3CA
MKKILVVEDELSVRENILELLEVEGFEVLGAGDGFTGIDLAEQYLPDLILCDVMMPKLDGFGVLSELRKKVLTDRIPLIFLTAKTNKSDLRKAVELGADDYITKPFTVEELLKAISASLEKTAVIEQKSQQQLGQIVNKISFSLHQEFRSSINSI